MRDEEEFKKCIPDGPDGENSSERERGETSCTTSHPPVSEVEFLRETASWSVFEPRCYKCLYLPPRSPTNRMYPQENKARPRSRTMKNIKLMMPNKSSHT